MLALSAKAYLCYLAIAEAHPSSASLHAQTRVSAESMHIDYRQRTSSDARKYQRMSNSG